MNVNVNSNIINQINLEVGPRTSNTNVNVLSNINNLNNLNQNFTNYQMGDNFLNDESNVNMNQFIELDYISQLGSQDNSNKNGNNSGNENGNENGTKK